MYHKPSTCRACSNSEDFSNNLPLEIILFKNVFHTFWCHNPLLCSLNASRQPVNKKRVLQCSFLSSNYNQLNLSSEKQNLNLISIVPIDKGRVLPYDWQKLPLFPRIEGNNKLTYLRFIGNNQIFQTLKRFWKTRRSVTTPCPWNQTRVVKGRII